MTTKAFIFDIDGVLNISQRFSIRIERDYGISTGKLLPFFNGIFRECLIGKADLKKELLRVLDVWGWQGSLDDLLDYWFVGEDNLDDKMTDILKNLGKKFPVFIATDNEKYRADYLRDNMGLGKICDMFFASAFEGFNKNNPQFYKSIFAKINQDRSFAKKEIMFWDDDMENIKAALDFGIDARVYKNFNDFKNEISTAIKI